MAVGILQALGSFRQVGFGARIWGFVLGILAIFIGFSIFQNPLAGVLALTTVVAIAFFAGGMAKIFLAFSAEDRTFFWVFLLAGVVSIVLAVMILSNFPRSAASILGLLLGIELLSNGISLLAFGFNSAEEKPV